MKVLIIEDERSLALEIEYFLKKSSFDCELAFTARQGLKALAENSYDFILLDLGLPDKDGLAVLQESRTMHPEAAYIILTARGDVSDRIRGLDLGADDYLPKPFSLPELQSRMQAIIRRRLRVNENVVAVGDFRIHLGNRTVSHNNTEITLSKKEFDLLNYMLLHKNRPLTRIQLSEHIWGNLCDDDYDSNYIDVHIKNIRKKMSVYAPVDWLETIRGVGYKLKMYQ